ncbi:hypothetical protein DFH28DRAFT_85845 [Melampsora americana]|nr:hypothetical protein DFH28DRAFT_85845 [Melampsora americana]
MNVSLLISCALLGLLRSPAHLVKTPHQRSLGLAPSHHIPWKSRKNCVQAPSATTDLKGDKFGEYSLDGNLPSKFRPVWTCCQGIFSNAIINAPSLSISAHVTPSFRHYLYDLYPVTHFRI